MFFFLWLHLPLYGTAWWPMLFFFFFLSHFRDLTLHLGCTTRVYLLLIAWRPSSSLQMRSRLDLFLNSWLSVLLVIFWGVSFDDFWWRSHVKLGVLTMIRYRKFLTLDTDLTLFWMAWVRMKLRIEFNLLLWVQWCLSSPAIVTTSLVSLIYCCGYFVPGLGVL